MDLKNFLTNSILSLKKEELADIIGPDENRYRKLVELSFSREMPLCWRAMWLTDYLSEIHPWIAKEYISRIWSEIPGNHEDGVTRSAIRLLTRYPIPEEYQAIATDICLDWLTKESVPVAIKAYCMEMLLNIAKTYPELSNEFIVIIEEQTPNNTVAYGARARHIIKALRKLQT